MYKYDDEQKLGELIRAAEKKFYGAGWRYNADAAAAEDIIW